MQLTAFIKTAGKFVGKDVKLDAAKEAAEITARLKKLVAIHNLKKAKTPADLQKALLKQGLWFEAEKIFCFRW